MTQNDTPTPAPPSLRSAWKVLFVVSALIAIPAVATGILISQRASAEIYERRSHTWDDLSYLLEGGEALRMNWTDALGNAGLTEKDGLKWSFARRTLVANYVPKVTGPATATFTPTSDGEVAAYICEARGLDAFLLHNVDWKGDFNASDDILTDAQYIDFCRRSFSEAGMDYDETQP